MASTSVLPPSIKSCVWLDCVDQIMPLEILTAPRLAGYQKRQVRFGFLRDIFEIQAVKTMDSLVKISIHRNINPNKKQDDGYALRFFVTMTGFDEGWQISIMNHDQEKSEPAAIFKLSERILEKINKTHHFFDVFVTAQMLEFKNFNEENEDKMKFDVYISSYFKPRLSHEQLKHLCSILKCRSLEDAFTGRLPISYMAEISKIIGHMARSYAKISEYLKARNGCNDSRILYADLLKILKYVGLENRHGLSSVDETCVKYLFAHKLGLECLKTITSDYLLSLLNKDYNNILDALEVSLQVHDEDLYDKAIFAFLNNFHKILSSEKFEWFSNQRAPITRLIIHSAQVWITKKDVYIPGWKVPSQLSSEL